MPEQDSAAQASSNITVATLCGIRNDELWGWMQSGDMTRGRDDHRVIFSTRNLQDNRPSIPLRLTQKISQPMMYLMRLAIRRWNNIWLNNRLSFPGHLVIRLCIAASPDAVSARRRRTQIRQINALCPHHRTVCSCILC